MLNVFHTVPHHENGGSGVPSPRQHHADAGVGCHSHNGHRIRSDAFPSSSSVVSVKIRRPSPGSGRLKSSSMVMPHTVARPAYKEKRRPEGHLLATDGSKRPAVSGYAASSAGSGSRTFATFKSLTSPIALNSFSVTHEMSNSYHARPWRADTGCA